MFRYCLLSCIVLLWPLALRGEEVTIRIDNVSSDEVGQEISRALGKVPGAKVSGTVTKDESSARVTFDPAKADVGDLARAVAGVKAAGGQQPLTRLALGYQRFDDSLIPDDEFVPSRVERSLAQLKGKGVSEKDWKLDTKKREIHILLDREGGAKLADIKSAFPSRKINESAIVAFEVK